MKNNKGITLVALVITIIVLLILAGVTLSLVIGQNGIIGKVENAKIETRGASVEEQANLWKADIQLTSYTEGMIKSLEQLINELLEQKLLTQDEKDQILGNEEKGIEATYQVTIGSRTIVFKEIVSRDGIKVGDYIHYEPDKASAYSKDKLGSNITGYGGDIVSDLTQEILKWQVLRIYGDGSIDIIGSPTTQGVYLMDALGYNNGVYVLNDICRSLYSKPSKRIEARSINIEDMEKWLTEEGRQAKNTYNNGIATYGEEKLYTQDSAYKPDIYGKTENKSDKYYSSPTTNTYDRELGSDGATYMLKTKQTSYTMPINQANYKEAYKVLASDVSSWIASRGVSCKEGNAFFGMYYTGSSITSYNLFSSYSYGSGARCSLRPVISLGSDIQITVSPTASTNSNTPHRINW